MELLLQNFKQNFHNKLSKALDDPELQVTDPIKFRIDLQYGYYSLVATLLIDHEDNKPPNFCVTLSNGLAGVL